MIPVATTTITVLSAVQTGDVDNWDAAAVSAEEGVTGVRAVISSPSGQATVQGGDQQIISARLNCDPIDLAHTDQVRDDTTGLVYQVVWSARRTGLGVDHTVADLAIVTDRAGV